MAKKEQLHRADYESTEEVELTLTFTVKAYRGALNYQGFTDLEDPAQLEELAAQVAEWGVLESLNKRWFMRTNPGAFYPRSEPEPLHKIRKGPN